MFPSAAAFSPDGNLIATAGWDGALYIWDARTKRQVRRWGNPPCRAGSPRLVQFVNNNIVALLAGCWVLWDVRTGRSQRQPYQPGGGASSPLALHPTKPLAAFPAKYGLLLHTYFGPGQDKPLESATCVPSGGILKNGEFSRDGQLVALRCEDNSISVWDVDTGVERRLGQTGRSLSDFIFTKDAQNLITSSYEDPLRVWDLKTGAIKMSVAHLRGRPLLLHSDGRRFMLGNQLIDLDTGLVVAEFRNYSPNIRTLDFSPDGRQLVATTNSLPAAVWDLSAPERPDLLGGFTGFRTADLAPDKKTLVTSTWNDVRLWDLRSGAQTEVLVREGLSGELALSGNGRRVAARTREGYVTVWDLDSTTAAKVNQFKPESSMDRIELSFDGRLAAFFSAFNNIVIVYDVNSGSQKVRLTSGSGQSISRVTFSGDGRNLALAYAGGVELWKLTPAPYMERLADEGKIDQSSSLDGLAFVGTTLVGLGSGRIHAWSPSIGPPPGSRPWHRETRIADAFGSSGLKSDVQFTLARDGTTVILEFPDGIWRVFDIDGHRLHPLRENSLSFDPLRFTQHFKPPGSPPFSEGSTYLGVIRSDGSLNFLAPNGQVVASVLALEDGEWAVVEPNGRFDVSRFSGNLPLNWVPADDPMRPLSVELYMRDFYVPGLLRRTLNREPLPAVPNLAERNRAQPQLFLDVSTPVNGLAEVKVKVKNGAYEDSAKHIRRSGARDLKIFRDGKLVDFVKGDLLGQLEEPDIKRAIRVPPSNFNRKVEFSAYAFNSDNVKSGTAVVNVDVTPDGPAPARRTHILAIGVDETFRSPSLRLSYAANDANQISAHLVRLLSKTGASATPVQSEVLTGTRTHPRAASKAAVKDAIARLGAKASASDLVIISFSGHGFTDEDGKFHLVPSDVDDSGAKQRTASSISTDELADWLRPVDAAEIVIVVDACQSAASVEGEGFKPGPMGSRGLGQLAYDKRMRILAASQSGGVALENGVLKHGLLTYALVVEGLDAEGADWQPKDGKITMGEWLSYGVHRVPQLDDKIRSGQIAVKGSRFVKFSSSAVSAPVAQTPALFDFRKPGEGDVVLKNPR